MKCLHRSSGLHSDCRRTEPVARVGEPNDRSDFEAARVDRELGVSRSGEGGLSPLWNMGSRGDVTLNDRGLWGSEKSETHRPRHYCPPTKLQHQAEPFPTLVHHVGILLKRCSRIIAESSEEGRRRSRRRRGQLTGPTPRVRGAPEYGSAPRQTSPPRPALVERVGPRRESGRPAGWGRSHCGRHASRE